MAKYYVECHQGLISIASSYDDAVEVAVCHLCHKNGQVYIRPVTNPKEATACVERWHKDYARCKMFGGPVSIRLFVVNGGWDKFYLVDRLGRKVNLEKYGLRNPQFPISGHDCGWPKKSKYPGAALID